jgi:hypothetical protein
LARREKVEIAEEGEMSDAATLRASYTADEAARILSISRSWLVTKAARDTDFARMVGAHRTGGSRGHWRFDPERFERYVANLRAGKIVQKPSGRQPGPTKKSRIVSMNEFLEELKQS